MRSAAMLLSLLMFAAVTTGCGTGVRTTKNPDIVFEHYNADIPIAIDVESFNGDVTIRVADYVDKITVSTRKESHLGVLYKDSKKAMMQTVNYTATIEQVDGQAVLQVRASSEHPEATFQSLHIEITAPAVDGLNIRTRRGRVYTRNVRGPVFISTSDADVRFLTYWPMTEQVTILNQNGDIDYRVRGESAGAFECEAIGGVVSPRVKFGDFTLYAGSNQHTVHGTLNGGENHVQLKTVDGDVRFAVVEDPLAVGTYIY